MMTPIVAFFMWFFGFVLLAVSFIFPKTKFRYFTLITMFLIFFGAAIHERLEYFTPINGLPDVTINFVYNHHKVHYIGSELYILLWITDVDNNIELVYNFPYQGNEKLKNELDNLKKEITNQTKSAGPYHYGGDPLSDDPDSDQDMILESDTQITITKEPE